MSIGLMGLLDDVAAIAKAAAASLDDVAAQAAHAGVKAVGVVIDDAAVTPRYVTGISPARELPIVGKIALGSLRNKLVFILPATLALSFLANFAIPLLLMIGGAYLCYEATEKIVEAAVPHHGPRSTEERVEKQSVAAFEAARVSSAVRTDLILSAEIMVVALGAVPEGSLWSQAVILALVGTAITAIVYGGVALIVKADDVGLALARRGVGKAWGGPVRAFGRGLVIGMPRVLSALSVVGTAAMLWVGGGILLHGLEVYGLDLPAAAVDALAWTIGSALPPAAAAVHWLVTAAASGIAGILVGGALLVVTGVAPAPVARAVRGRWTSDTGS